MVAQEITVDDPITEARAMVETLHDAEITAVEHYFSLQAQLVDLKRDAADAALSAAMAGTTKAPTILRTVAHLRDESEAVLSAIEAARRKRADAIPEVWQAEADELARQAAALIAEADARQPEYERLMAALRDFESCDFQPKRSPAPNDPGVGRDALMIVSVPRTQRLRSQAETLLTKARDLPRRRINQGGAIHAASRDELVSSLKAWDSMKMAPSIVDVLAWYDEHAQNEIHRRESLPSHASNWINPAAPVPCEFVWTNGAFDPRSKVGQGTNSQASRLTVW